MEHTHDSIYSKVEKRIIDHGSKGGFLNLRNMELKERPPSIGNLSNLETLSLYNNELKEVPLSIGNLINLEQLYLDNNRLIELPQSITRLTNLICINLVYEKGNEDLIYPPYSLIKPFYSDYEKQGEVILEYCRTHNPIKTRYNKLWNCIKLMYIGHYKEIIHCKDTFGNIPIEVIGVISRYILADPYILNDRYILRKRNNYRRKRRGNKTKVYNALI